METPYSIPSELVAWVAEQLTEAAVRIVAHTVIYP